MFDTLLDRLFAREASVAVVGLGYVGLPLAIALSKHFKVIGYDLNQKRVERLSEGNDETGEVDAGSIRQANIRFTSDPADITDARFIIVSVPTPIDDFKRPDLRPLISAARTVAQRMTRGSVVVFESTVYPGVTEEEAAPAMEAESNMKCGLDFKVGYSPERINPGDKEHTIEKVVKVVSGQDAETLEIVAGVYGAVVTAGVHRAESIKVAESAKVIENIQRDLNIALMNELAIIFDLVGVDTGEVLEAAGTKWNFLKFKPGLVGGHCIGVDPYYLTSKAEKMGYHPQVILAGRRINDWMGKFIAEQVLKNLDVAAKEAKVGVLGLTFKENVPDIRNSRAPDIIRELARFGVRTVAHDPVADPDEVKKELGVKIDGYDDLKNLDCVVLAVNHAEYIAGGAELIRSMLKSGGAVIDVKSVFTPGQFGDSVTHWRL